jgi:predicted Fe-Mo cluster-binding NifX family protein
VIPVKDKKDLESTLDNRFGRAPYFLFVNLEKDEIRGFYFIDNKFKNKKVRAGLAAAKLIVDQKSQVLIANQVGEISFHALHDNLIDIYQTKKAKTAKEAISLFLKGEIDQLVEPTKEKN